MYRTVITGASCKNCGGTVLIIVTGLPDVMPHYKRHSGGVNQQCAQNVTRHHFTLLKYMNINSDLFVNLMASITKNNGSHFFLPTAKNYFYY
jgi:hypothetical protein